MTTVIDLFDLHDRVAIITGGAGLLGKEFSRTLAEAGAKVVVADLDGASAARAADELTFAGEQAGLPVQVDVTRPDSVRAMMQQVLDAFGRLDILVNSAALDPKFDPQHDQNHTDSFEQYPLHLWQQAIDVNLTGSFLCCQAAVVPMLAQGQGVIINIGSIYGLVGPDQRIYSQEGDNGETKRSYKPAFYSVSKAGLLGLTRYLATYYAGSNIRVNALTPGGVNMEHSEPFLSQYSARTVMGRMAHKKEMNGALLFLASDASSYMTGSNLIVDGGWTAW